MTQAYVRGFMNKCAEYGVDGRQLLKVAVPVDQNLRSQAWNFLSSAPRNIGRLFNRAGKKLSKSYFKHLKNPAKTPSPITVDPSPYGPRFGNYSGQLTPEGTNMMQKAILDKIPISQHSPALSNAVWNAWADHPAEGGVTQ